eukprot:6730211-Pyramimonas_sp.AAC.1
MLEEGRAAAAAAAQPLRLDGPGWTEPKLLLTTTHDDGTAPWRRAVPYHRGLPFSMTQAATHDARSAIIFPPAGV